MTEQPPPSANAQPPFGADGIVRAGEWTAIANEFTGVRLRKVWTPQGERLEIDVPKRGYRILLDAMQLEIVAAQDPAKFSELFAIRLGSHKDASDQDRSGEYGAV